MSKIINLPTVSDTRGHLTYIERLMDIKRVYFLHGFTGKSRGGHRHKKTRQILICTSGYCNIDCETNVYKHSVFLDTPTIGLIVEPEDYHTIYNMSPDCVLMILASEYHDEEDYIYDKI